MSTDGWIKLSDFDADDDDRSGQGLGEKPSTDATDLLLDHRRHPDIAGRSLAAEHSRKPSAYEVRSATSRHTTWNAFLSAAAAAAVRPPGGPAGGAADPAVAAQEVSPASPGRRFRADRRPERPPARRRAVCGPRACARCGAAVRAGNLAGPGFWFPLWFPGHVAHGNYSGTPGAGI